MTDPQTLNAIEATVLRAIQSYFDRNPYETKVQFIDLIVDLDGRLVAGKLKPVVEHLIHLGCLWGSTSGSLELTARGLSSLEAVKLPSEESFSHFSDLLLVALADHDRRSIERDLNFYGFDLREVAKLYRLSFSRTWIQRAGELFKQRQWASIHRNALFGEDGGVFAELTGLGLVEAERLRGRLVNQGVAQPTYPPSDGDLIVKTATEPSAGTAPISVAGRTEVNVQPIERFVPASDRVVRLNDNAPGRREAVAYLEKIESELKSGSNELKLTADERSVVLSETRPLRERLSEGWVRVGDLVNAVAPRGILAWLVDKLSGTTLGEIAKAVVSSISALLRSLF